MRTLFEEPTESSEVKFSLYSFTVVVQQMGATGCSPSHTRPTQKKDRLEGKTKEELFGGMETK